MPEPGGPWRMFAERYNGVLLHVGDRLHTELYIEASGETAGHLIEVEIREVGHDDPDGTHWGWLDGDGDAPVMIQPRRPMFDMQFEYGPEVEERRGKGRIVRLAVREVTSA